MEIFITLTNIILACGVKKVIAASGDYLVYFHPSQSYPMFFEEWDIPINVDR